MENKRSIEITFPVDMLWQDVSEEDYNEPATCDGYERDIAYELGKAGYQVEIAWALINHMTIEDENGDPITDSDYHHIRNIIDRVEVDYIS